MKATRALAVALLAAAVGTGLQRPHRDAGAAALGGRLGWSGDSMVTAPSPQ
jgi:hypothetical protein